MNRPIRLVAPAALAAVLMVSGCSSDEESEGSDDARASVDAEESEDAPEQAEAATEEPSEETDAASAEPEIAEEPGATDDQESASTPFEGYYLDQSSGEGGQMLLVDDGAALFVASYPNGDVCAGTLDGTHLSLSCEGTGDSPWLETEATLAALPEPMKGFEMTWSSGVTSRNLVQAASDVQDVNDNVRSSVPAVDDWLRARA
ncbi:hypothetical protein [Streptomyces profundus]|uniref:hypothetical protein n=1 Tax=Streptomyces profundus TaxID=2867410 RepID=UPI001D16830A|nr:hypothetical protein [Streptomyces sp. MA3_2.13]UED87227.1 hypothetical protein K4G22_25950 [Streptomyces sp. MA3_2.13]